MMKCQEFHAVPMRSWRLSVPADVRRPTVVGRCVKCRRFVWTNHVRFDGRMVEHANCGWFPRHHR